MFQTVTSPRTKAIFALSAAALLLGLTACSAGVAPAGASDVKPLSSAQKKQAEDLAASAAAPQSTWHGPTTAVKPVSGLTIGVVTCGLAQKGCVRETEGVQAAAKALGWTVIVIDGKTDTQTQQTGVDTLINRKVDAIINNSVAASSLGDQIARSKAAGIPWISTFATDPVPLGGTALISVDNIAVGEASAAYVASHGGGNVVEFTTADLPQVGQRSEGFEKYAAASAPNITILDKQTVPLVQVGVPEQGVFNAMLQKYPSGKIDWLFAGFDTVIRPLVQTAEVAGRTEIKGVSSDGDLETLSDISKGNISVMTVGFPLEWAGWGAIDQVVRIKSGLPVAADEGIRFRILDKTSVPKDGSPYTGDLDFAAKFKTLWGI